MHKSQWEMYKAARDKALHVPPLSQEDQDFLNTPGPWSRSGHYNLGQTITSYRTLKQQTLVRSPGSAPSLTALGFGLDDNLRRREEDRLSFVGSIASGVPLAEEVLGARAPPRGRQAPQLRSDSANSARAKHLPPFFVSADPFQPGVPDKRPFILHSPCRDYNFVNTKAW
eukprot:TRINITY_DN112943_c0_g1_i1.p1 TRINITY_DN112943_c0_g1~~TRINITY_DN112943_c0_g1_i1.p1  ORF type:complete len:170 (-),score=24.74 TRINITY_DN112943_c0_g1_i1:48-557(-)